MEEGHIYPRSGIFLKKVSEISGLNFSVFLNRLVEREGYFDHLTGVQSQLQNLIPITSISCKPSLEIAI